MLLSSGSTITYLFVRYENISKLVEAVAKVFDAQGYLLRFHSYPSALTNLYLVTSGSQTISSWPSRRVFGA